VTAHPRPQLLSAPIAEPVAPDAGTTADGGAGR
jgi:hypothetical protein